MLASNDSTFFFLFYVSLSRRYYILTRSKLKIAICFDEKNRPRNVQGKKGGFYVREIVLGQKTLKMMVPGVEIWI